MDVRVLGAHSLESNSSRLSCLLVDNVLALDAGSLTSALSFEEQERIGAILLTHYHFDHIKDMATFGLATAHIKTTPVLALAVVLEALRTHIMNGEIYPKFAEWPVGSPSFAMQEVHPLEVRQLLGYEILAVPVSHSVPAVGYQVSDKKGKKLFYTGDTGAGLSASWPYVSPDLLITELSGSNGLKARMTEAGHLYPELLKQELGTFRQMKGYLPGIVVTHLIPRAENEVRAEIAAVAVELGVTITVASEGMVLSI